jgi:hypothetical protein
LGDYRCCSELMEQSGLNIVNHYFCYESGSKLTSYCLCSKIMTVSDEICTCIVRMYEGENKRYKYCWHYRNTYEDSVDNYQTI